MRLEPLSPVVCRHAPFLVPFLERAKVFQELVVS